MSDIERIRAQVRELAAQKTGFGEHEYNYSDQTNDKLSEADKIKYKAELARIAAEQEIQQNALLLEQLRKAPEKSTVEEYNVESQAVKTYLAKDKSSVNAKDILEQIKKRDAATPDEFASVTDTDRAALLAKIKQLQNKRHTNFNDYK